ncbi:putative enoyl-CoA hydratase [bacterium HR30]|nr:putative enoyl-CoA hydratase [bacterium HR30]
MGTVEVEDVEAVRILVLHRPPANAIEETLLGDLQTALAEAKADARVRALVLTGSGSFFSAGFDFRSPTRSEEQAAAFYQLYRDTHVALLSFPKPTVAWIQGHAIAGGLVLALACDYRLGVDSQYQVGLNEIAVGAAYPRAALEIIRLRLPHARAAELMLGASLYPSSQAVRLGLVDELLPPDTARQTVLRRAARLGAYPAEAYAHTKCALVEPALRAIASETEEEARATRAIWQSAEGRAARHRQRERLLSR